MLASTYLTEWPTTNMPILPQLLTNFLMTMHLCYLISSHTILCGRRI